MAVEEKTPMTVSVDAVLLFLIYVMNTANATEKSTSDKSGETEPSSTPMAMPVNAPCPSESEKKAMRLATTIVLIRPKSGVTSKMARNAFCMKWCAAHSKGSSCGRKPAMVSIRHSSFP